MKSRKGGSLWKREEGRGFGFWVDVGYKEQQVDGCSDEITEIFNLFSDQTLPS